MLLTHSVRISAHVKSIAGIKDETYYDCGADFLTKLAQVRTKEFPVIDDAKGEEMKAAIEAARMDQDSECD